MENRVDSITIIRSSILLLSYVHSFPGVEVVGRQIYTQNAEIRYKINYPTTTNPPQNKHSKNIRLLYMHVSIVLYMYHTVPGALNLGMNLCTC